MNGSINGCSAEEGEEKQCVMEARFECPICLSCLKDPCLTSCGHRFCSDCIHEWIRKKGSRCPIDSQELIAERDLFQDNYTRREIAQQVVECPFPECGLRLPLLESEAHIAQAHNKVATHTNGEQIQCPFKNIGCEFVFKSTNKMLTHTQAYLNYHLHLLTNAHKVLEAEMWSPTKESAGSNSSIGQDLNALVKSLYEKIVVLEQESREQKIEVSRLTESVSRLSLENTTLRRELAQRVCAGTLIWRVTDFSGKLANMTKQSTVNYYSDPFYTSYIGYRFCARLNVSPHDASQLSIVVHMMQGEHDHALSWPFSGRIAVTLVHPGGEGRSVREVMCSRPELEAFQRPTKHMSMRAFGYTEFIPTSTLLSQGFVSPDDSIVIKIQISCV